MTVRNRQKKNTRILGKVLFVLYIAFLVYFLIFSDRYGRQPGSTYSYNLLPFKEIQRFWQYRYQLGFVPVFTNLIGNVLIFIPFGFFLPMASKFRNMAMTVFLSFGLSLCVEMIQFMTQVGSFDVDDLILNTLGGWIGYYLFTRFHAASVKRRRQTQQKKT